MAIIPCDYQVTLPSGAAVRADQAVRDAVFERRSAGNGSKGPRYSDWSMTATAIPGQYLLIRRLLSRGSWNWICRHTALAALARAAGRRHPRRTRR